MTIRLARLVFAVALVLCLVQILVYFPKLPAMMASHFDGNGQPNGWSSKAAFFSLHAIVLIAVVALFGALPLRLRNAPDSWINLPHKDYWLASERRAATLESIATVLTWFGTASFVMLLGVTQLVIRYNLGQAEDMPSTPLWTLIVAFVAVVFFLIAWLMRFMRRPRI